MGVHGLWRLIEPSGKPVPLESLENKILAIDISIWLHQAVKGFQDSRGAPLPNAHLLGIYHRVCKLLYFRVKPVFVFDGGVPALKKQTIAKRNQLKTKNLNQANDIQTKLIKTLLKQSAVSKVITEKAAASLKTKVKPKPENEKTTENMFKLPELPSTEQHLDSTMDSSYSSDDESSSSSPTKQWDLHTIDEKSEHFRSLPADVRHEILTELKETRKQSSWGRIHELPTESNDFASFQIKRLLKRHSVQLSLWEAENEMGGHSLSLGELETLLNEEGIVTSSETGGRIASDENARYLLIKDVQKAMEKAKQDEKKKLSEESCSVIVDSTSEIVSESVENDNLATDTEFQRDLEAAIQLSLQDQPSTSKKSDTNFVENFRDADFQSESDSDEDEGPASSRLKSAQSYMLEYSGLTPNEIAKIISGNAQKPKIPKKQTFNPQIKIIPEAEESEPNIIHEIDKKDVNKDSKMSDIKIPEKENEINNKMQEITSIDSSDSDSDFVEVTSASDKKYVDDQDKSTLQNEIKNKMQVSSVDSSESDSDFVEVTSASDKKSVNEENKSALEIVINPNDNVGDDIFSDVFSEITKEEKTETKTFENIQERTSKQEIKNIDVNVDKEMTNDTKIIEHKESKEMEKIVEPEKPQLTVEELNVMKSNLVTEGQQLLTERNTKERMAGNITDQMYLEAQELLELFGVPYIIAPMEAEAQCAFLDEIDLTDGTITDDSDVWLFGGKTVYKNFFNHNKHVLEFRSESIEHHFKLTREQLILLALLVGSDYTLGLQGIGPVTALEILAAFPPAKNTNITVLTQDELISGLSEFRRWLSDGRSLGPGRTVLRNKLRNVTLSDGFPSLQVVKAYLQPKVETCRDRFTWGKPDIVGLIDYAKEKFGWTKLKSEEILKPVMRKLDDKNIQKTIKDYFATKHKLDADLPENKLSKRVKTAINKMGKTDDDTNEDKKPKTTRKRAPRKTKKNDIVNTSENNNMLPPKRKPPTKKPEASEAKEYIPQKERDKLDALKSKLKAIEVFRKSKQGPGYVKRRGKLITPLKEEAELSESSSSD